jgi:hypothetical protein
MKNLFYDNVSELNYKELIELLNNSQCLAFIGAGLSVEAGYRNWREGIFEGMGTHPLVGRPGLMALSGLQSSDIADCLNDYPEIVSRCKKKLDLIDSDIFINYLRDEFGPNEERYQHYTKSHKCIWSTKFQHIITTNFDHCFYRSITATECKDIVAYPNLTFKEVRALYHLHGRAYLLQNEPKEDEIRHLRNLIYTKGSYDYAYNPEQREISTFLYSMIKKYCFVFIAFSLDDEDFKRTLLSVIDARRELEKSIAKLKSTISKPRPHFVILDAPERTNYSSDIEYNEAIRIFDDRKRKIELKGMLVVAFFAKDKSFSGLKWILQNMESKARYYALPGQSESPFKMYNDLTPAATTESPII